MVGGITGIRVWETVTDRVFDQADEVVLVDLPPDELLQRLKEGKVYLADQAERAIQNFFRKGNLITLRELALRRTAERVDEEMQSYQPPEGGTPPILRDALLVCVGPDPVADVLVRAASRLANKLDCEWRALYVETPALQRLPEHQLRAILNTLKLAQDLGAHTATMAADDIAQTLITYACQHRLSRLVVGQLTARSRYQAQVAHAREERTRYLYEMSRELSGALVAEQVIEISERCVEASFRAKTRLLLPDEHERLQQPLVRPGKPKVDLAIAQWCFDRNNPAGLGTDTLPAASLLSLPLKAPLRTRGVLAVAPEQRRRLMIPEQRRVLDTFAALIAIGA